MASTAIFFIVPGQGSPPKTSGATVTEQNCFPTQFCNKPFCVKTVENFRETSAIVNHAYVPTSMAYGNCFLPLNEERNY